MLANWFYCYSTQNNSILEISTNIKLGTFNNWCILFKTVSLTSASGDFRILNHPYICEMHCLILWHQYMYMYYKILLQFQSQFFTWNEFVFSGLFAVACGQINFGKNKLIKWIFWVIRLIFKVTSLTTSLSILMLLSTLLWS